MTDVKRDAVIQSNGTKESPFFDQNFEDKDILTNIVIPVIFVVIGKFKINQSQHDLSGFGMVPIPGFYFEFSYTRDAGQFCNSTFAVNQRLEKND